MSKPQSPSRTKSLDNIQHNLDSLIQWAGTQSDIFAKVVTDSELERIEEIVTRLVMNVEMEMDGKGARREGPDL